MGVRTCRVVGRLLAFGLSVVVIGLCCQSTVMADVGLSLRVNLWETVPSDDPVYEDLSKLADLGIIRLPSRAQTSLLTRYDIADLIYRADRELRSRSEETELSFGDGSGREIVAGLREEYAAEIQWVSRNYTSMLGNNSDQITDKLSLSGIAGLSDREGVSSELPGYRGVPITVPELPPASAVESDPEADVSYSIDPLVMRISGLAVNVAGIITQFEDSEHGFRNISQYLLYPKSVRGLKYRIDAWAESSGFELHLSHEGMTSMPRQSVSVDASQSEASATYEISPSVRLVAGMVAKSDQEGFKSESGVGLTFQVVPRYLWANLGLNVSDSESYDMSGPDDWRRFRTEIGLSGQYPISSEAMVRAAYSYLRYSSASERSQTVLSTGVDYTPLPGTTVSAELEVKDDPEKGLSSVKGVGLGYEINPDTSVMLNLFQTEGTGGSGETWGAEFQWKFKF